MHDTREVCSCLRNLGSTSGISVEGFFIGAGVYHHKSNAQGAYWESITTKTHSLAFRPTVFS
jgi:hypothetical protein